MSEPAPEGFEVERVDWLPSGGRSGLVRVRGRWRVPGPLPDLLIATPAGEERHASLPDPRAGRDPATWRGAYVVHADVVAACGDRMALVTASGARLALPRPTSEALRDGEARAAGAVDTGADAGGPGGAVIDRAVLAERRARRAEAAEQAQARIAREALRAVEVLELRTGDLEARLEALAAERDALAASGAAPAPTEAPADRGREAEALRDRIVELEAELAEARADADALRERAAEPVAPPPVAPEPAPSAADSTEADRRVQRLRAALASAVVTIGELRLALQQSRVQRRTADVERGADAVRLTVLMAEREAVGRELHRARERAAAAGEREAELRRELERADARTAGTEAEHRETRRQLEARSAELAEVRERAAALEAELAAARAEAERIAERELPAAVAEAVQRRERELGDEHASALADAETALAAARAEVERLHEQLGDVRAARELAEASAAAATSERQAAEVAWAAAADELAALRAGEAPSGPDLAAELERERAARRRLERALELAERAGAVAAEPGALGDLARGLAAPRSAKAENPQLLADLDAAAAALREAAAQPPADDAAGDHPGPATFLPPAPPTIDRPAPFAASAEGPRIITPAADPPARPAPEERRAYPTLRGALVKLAHDDAAAAACLLAGLLPAQWRLVHEPVDYDLTIAELGTYAITVQAGGAHVEAVEQPRRGVDFHLRTDALTLAEIIAGHGPTPRRFGRAKVTGRRRRLRALRGLPAAGMSLPDAVRAGATLEPVAALRCLAYAVHPAATRGHAFTVAVELPDAGATVVLEAGDGRGLAVTAEPGETGADATVRLTRPVITALLRGEEPPEPPEVTGDRSAVERLRAWAEAAVRAE